MIRVKKIGRGFLVNLVCVLLLSYPAMAYNEPEGWPETYPWDFEVYGPYAPDDYGGGTTLDDEPTGPSTPVPDSPVPDSDSELALLLQDVERITQVSQACLILICGCIIYHLFWGRRG